MRDRALHSTRMSEINPHPVRRGKLLGFRNSDFARRGSILRFPTQGVVVASVAEMKKTSRRHQEIEGRIELLANRRAQGTGLGPVLELVDGRNQGEPVGHVDITQSTRGFLQIRLEMIQSDAMFRIPFPRDLGKPLQ